MIIGCSWIILVDALRCLIWSDHVSICEWESTWIGCVWICWFCLIVLLGRLFQLSKVGFGSTKIGEEFWRLSGGVNDRWGWFEEVDWVFQGWIVGLASTWIGCDDF